MPLEIQDIFPVQVAKDKLDRVFTEEEQQVFAECSLNTARGLSNSNSVNMNVLDDPRLSNIRSLLEGCIQEYLISVEGCSEDVSGGISLSWLNFTQPDEYHPIHRHPNSFISGVLYIDLGDESGLIMFQQPSKNLIQPAAPSHPAYLRDFKLLHVRTGDILLFPSYLEHSVPKNTSGRTRVSLAFNTFLRGTIGTPENATYLELY